MEQHPASFREAPLTENAALPAAAPGVEISSASLQLIDRVLSATAKDFDHATVETFRSWLHGYMCKLGRDHQNQPTPNAHPPKDDLVAQFLTIAEPRRLGTLLDSLMLDRQTCYSYGWFVTVALQRIHGLHFKEQQRARAAVAVVRAGGRSVSPAWQQETIAGLEAIAKAKRIRASVIENVRPADKT